MSPSKNNKFKTASRSRSTGDADDTSTAANMDRSPPHHLDAEAGLIASCIIDGGGLILNECIAKNVSSGYFFDVRNQLLFSVMVEMKNNNIAIDDITLTDSLRKAGHLEKSGGAAYISSLTNRIEVTAHASYWLEIVCEKYFRRELIRSAQDAIERAYTLDDDLDSLLDTVEQNFYEISENRIKSNSIAHIREPAHEAVELVNFLSQNKGAITGVPTGFDELDKMCFGFHPGQMIVVAARPGMGKTSIALNFIEAALFPKTKTAKKVIPTLLFSLEMPSRELALRLLCSRSGANLRQVRDGFTNKDTLRSIADIAAEYQNKPLYIDDQGGQTILEIRAKARRIAQQEKIGLVVIDYLQLINGTDERTPREQQIAQASRSIKAMAKELNLPVVALAQLNRKSEDENRAPRMSDLRESGSIEQDADMVMIIDKKRRAVKKKERTDSAEPDDDEVGHDVVPRQLIIAKQRNGPTGEIELLFRKSLTRFETPAHTHT
ncbi:MAG: replicative DNA helicase [Puniceicoccales bacterium]|jgi:replicative DNA helicase|nr:replicative DNA helicase [Puniceicoccales bacterium]